MEAAIIHVKNTAGGLSAIAGNFAGCGIDGGQARTKSGYQAFGCFMRTQYFSDPGDIGDGPFNGNRIYQHKTNALRFQGWTYMLVSGLQTQYQVGFQGQQLFYIRVEPASDIRQIFNFRGIVATVGNPYHPRPQF
jgi:hypothetical protein